MQHLVHVQTNASVDSSELLQSYWNADSSSLTVAGPSCHADSPLCYGVRSRPPLSVSRCQLPVSSFVQPTLFSRPVTTSGHGEISSPKPFVWFRAKTDKGIVCLAGHLHSVTSNYGPDPKCFGVKAGFYPAFGAMVLELEAFVGISGGVVVNICDNLAILIFSSLKLYSMVNFVLGWRFGRKLCTSFMLLHEYFKNMRGSPRDVMSKVQPRSKQVRTPVAALRSLSS